MEGDINLRRVTCSDNKWSDRAPLCLPDETETVGLEKLKGMVKVGITYAAKFSRKEKESFHVVHLLL